MFIRKLPGRRSSAVSESAPALSERAICCDTEQSVVISDQIAPIEARRLAHQAYLAEHRRVEAMMARSQAAQGGQE